MVGLGMHRLAMARACGEVHHQGWVCAVLQSITSLRLNVFFSMHTHVTVTRASWKPGATGEVCRCCGPPAQAWLFAVQRQAIAGRVRVEATMASVCWAVPGRCSLSGLQRLTHILTGQHGPMSNK